MSRLLRPGATVEMAHGGGGLATTRLVREIFARHFANPILAQGHDAARIEAPSGRLVMTTDAHVVSPLEFPGGDIGSLAVHGTINDVAMGGAQPIALSAAFIIEEGFPLETLDRIAQSMGRAARDAGVPIVTGDTKVVERGHGDGVYIATTGIGVVPEGVTIAPENIAPGMAILVSGTLGDHGVAILSRRQGLEFSTTIASDSAALHRMVADMVAAVPDIAVLRDPTRGGLSATLNELAEAAGVTMTLDEAAIPVRPEVAGACELLGLDPMHIANEGKLVCICPADRAQDVLDVMRSHPEGRDAALIGTVGDRAAPGTPGLLRMTTLIGGTRVVDWLAGEPLPRIC
ncbi:Hydrogenase expression/formation protein hypE [Novosphingobium nitrogenifigens DSM 19370]|uniref:Hydrogenase expression/formation protein hypE n=1 Tax=Novosphingobium nitrogenifigens DSM 19370 TaxID=983920 RepID=F1Z414_9SPHN|nr:hydrogenase expression/formation protein HypE [Novosphingobium nitrogenifigens]EGD60626.1 Hydrogenase expression/formation protein hypE [Novosphingobium nitrogenifigens DSM 19370]